MDECLAWDLQQRSRELLSEPTRQFSFGLPGEISNRIFRRWTAVWGCPGDKDCPRGP